MNPYQYRCTCSVCGEEGFAHVRDAGNDYLGGGFIHTDPMQCAQNIEARKRKIDSQKEKQQIMADGGGI